MIGIPDPKFGEELCAWIVLKPGEAGLDPEAVREFCRGQIAHYKIPRHVRFVECFPHRHRQGAARVRHAAPRPVIAELDLVLERRLA